MGRRHQAVLAIDRMTLRPNPNCHATDIGQHRPLPMRTEVTAKVDQVWQTLGL